MRGGSWETMSSTCIQSGGALPRPLGGNAFENTHMIGPHSPAPGWHMHSLGLVKQEPMDHDSIQATFSSENNNYQARNGEPQTVTYSSHHGVKQLSGGYYSAPVSIPVSTNAGYQSTLSNNLGFNPLTPPSFESVTSPHSKILNSSPRHDSPKDTTLTPCHTPPTEDTPPKSPKSDANDYFPKNDDNPLRRLEMTFERNGLLPSESPKSSEHRESEDDELRSDFDEDDLNVPRVNSHGKVKTFKCKQCDFVAVTKKEFWEHSKSHIKPEKLLTCPKCPFVTEYKHHLEYHLRNHFGSKPFKCDKCSYSCVNKSMLNSHLKSHSNVYQYSCADCTYATKYCHSLKLHLRKYSHKPAMVLNPDGTPNPLPIIDVYGTRRGPKQKPKLSDEPPQSIPPIQNSPFSHFMVNSQPLQFPFLYNPLLNAISSGLILPKSGALTQEQEESKIDSDDEEDSTAAPFSETSREQETEDEALDLSKPEVSLPITVPELSPSIPPITNKNRRKGKAFKLERANSSQPEGAHINKCEPQAEEKDETSAFNCQYCDIMFKDIVMYTMHMGYHGFKDPFTCNMCGEQSVDKVAFFLHIARNPHS